MKANVVRLAVLIPLGLSLVSLFRPLFPEESVVGQLFMAPSTIYGLASLALIWFWYFSSYRYGRQLLLGSGILSGILTSLILIGHYFHFSVPGMHYLLPPSNTPFLLNLTYMFLACYIIQIATYWLPRTKLLVNGSLAVILFMAILSIFGRLYDVPGIDQDGLLIPMPFGAILGFLTLSLTIFIHTNHMARIYLSARIILSFALMFIAVVGANIVIYKNINQTTDNSTKANQTRLILADIHSIDFYLDKAQNDIQTYEALNDPTSLSSYNNNKQLYLTAIQQLNARTEASGESTVIRQSITEVKRLGDQIIVLGDSTATTQHQKLPTINTRTTLDKQLDAYMDQLLDEITTVNLAYTGQLNQLIKQEARSDRGIILGVSVTSALTLLLIIFTPLFIRQTIQELSAAQAELKHSNRLLSDEKSRAEAILAGIGDGLFAVDVNHNLTLFNQAAELISGLKKEAVLGRRLEDSMHFALLKNNDKRSDFIGKALRGAESHLTHGIALVRGETSIDVQISASPIKNPNGAVVGAIVVFRDRSNEQALDNAKDEFVSLASHQLRTPATATKQFLAMFLQGYAGTITDQQRIYLQEAYDNNELGISIIEELLNITRLESNKLKLVKEKIELGDFLTDSIAQHQTFAARAKQSMKFVKPHKHIYIESDRSLLSMAVDNLITNALKYTPEGGLITVRLSDTPRPSIAVSDNGIGIKEEDMKKIFERFTRLEDPQKQHVSGTGIGLYLVKKIVKKLQAEIKLQSKYGKGTTFTLIFKALE